MIVKQVTTKQDEDNAVCLQINGGTICVTNDDVSMFSLNTNVKLKTFVEKILGKSEDIYFHINRDGSIAVATGSEPELYPEDET